MAEREIADRRTVDQASRDRRTRTAHHHGTQRHRCLHGYRFHKVVNQREQRTPRLHHVRAHWPWRISPHRREGRAGDAGLNQETNLCPTNRGSAHHGVASRLIRDIAARVLLPALSERRTSDCAGGFRLPERCGDPDPFRLRYRNQIGAIVRAVVTATMGKREASRWIAARTRELIDGADQARFQEVVETELSGLHEGNIARYRLRLSEFRAWEAGWN